MYDKEARRTAVMAWTLTTFIVGALCGVLLGAATMSRGGWRAACAAAVVLIVGLGVSLYRLTQHPK